MTESNRLLSILQEKFAESRARNPSFSLRAYARQLGLAPSTLSSLLSGKLPVTQKMVYRILPRMNIGTELETEILKLATVPGDKVRKESRGFIQVEADQYQLISEWHHFAILSLAETEGFESDTSWIATRLGITKQQVELALQRLSRAGLIQTRQDGDIELTGKQFTTTTDVACHALKKTNFQNIELARKSLEQDELASNDFTAITMAIDPAKIPDAKTRIREFRRELCQFLESGEQTEVYRLFTCFFPLSKTTERQEK